MTALYTSIIKAAAKLSAHLNMLLAYISCGQATSPNPFNAFRNDTIFNLGRLIKYYTCINLQLKHKKNIDFQPVQRTWQYVKGLELYYGIGTVVDGHLISNQVNMLGTYHMVKSVCSYTVIVARSHTDQVLSPFYSKVSSFHVLFLQAVSPCPVTIIVAFSCIFTMLVTLLCHSCTSLCLMNRLCASEYV